MSSGVTPCGNLCGYWLRATDLDAAQEAKFDLICRKLGLHAGMTVLDIGGGQIPVTMVPNHDPFPPGCGRSHFGFDTDTPDVFDRTIDVLEEIKIDSVAVNILIPYPGTEFYKKFEKVGISASG